MTYIEGKTKCARCASTISDSDLQKQMSAGTCGWGYVSDGECDPIAFCPACKTEYMKRNAPVSDVYSSAHKQQAARREKEDKAFREDHYLPYIKDCLQLAREMCDEKQPGDVVPISGEVH
jgi:hypothetical protein